MKQAFTNRLYLLLLDGQPHELSEAWDWLVAAIPPQIAVRAFHRRIISAVNQAKYSLEQQIEEGAQGVVKSQLWGLENGGIIEVARPDREKRMPCAPGFMDFREAVVQLTEKGKESLLNHFNGKWTKALRELRDALKLGRVAVTVTVKY